jgi:Reverse transcriptase (RNA-dependent DNA polymerase)
LSDFQPPNEEEDPPPPLLDPQQNIEEAIQWLAEEKQEQELEGHEEVESEGEEEEEINIIEDSVDEVEQRAPRAIRELKSLGIVPKSTIPREVQKLNTYYNPTYTAHVNLKISSDPGEPKTMKEALLGPEKEPRKEAIKKEIANYMSRGVWKPVSRKMVTEQMKRKLISTKWIFKKKTEQDNTIRHKARVVSRGFMQIPGVDYSESFAPVASDTSIRVIIASNVPILPPHRQEIKLGFRDV